MSLMMTLLPLSFCLCALTSLHVLAKMIVNVSLHAGPGPAAQVPKGPAGSSGAAVHALHALMSVLLCTLGHSSFPAVIPGGGANAGSGGPASGVEHAEGSSSAMDALKAMEAKARQGKVNTEDEHVTGVYVLHAALRLSVTAGKIRLVICCILLSVLQH